MKLHISNSANRDATIVATSLPAKEGTTPSKAGKPVTFKRYVAAGEGKLHEALVVELKNDFAQQLIQADPEIDMEMVGKVIGETNTVLLTQDNQPLYCAPELQEIIYGPDGKEIERRTPVEVAPNVNEEVPVKWTGKLIPRADLVRKYGIKRTMQLRHVDGVTFDFLYSMAQELHEKDSVMLLAAGEGGKGPLVLQSNGSPYRGFLEGRIQGDTFLLLLHLSAMELKKPAAKAEMGDE
jgi:hypothetical protein